MARSSAETARPIDLAAAESAMIIAHIKNRSPMDNKDG